MSDMDKKATQGEPADLFPKNGEEEKDDESES